MNKLRIQTASDVVRDGLGVELIKDTEPYEVFAEIFRSDRDKSLTVSTFGYELCLSDLERLIKFAYERLDPFEDGTPLSDAVRSITPRFIRPK